MDFVMFSSDGKRLAAAGRGKGYLFDVATGQAFGTPIDDVSQSVAQRRRYHPPRRKERRGAAALADVRATVR